MISVRFATSEDLKGINTITKEFSNNDTHPPQYFKDAIVTNNIFVAVDNKEIVGYLVYHVIWGNTPFIELLKITAQYQRKGIGAQLLLELEKKIKMDGYKFLTSSSEKVNAIGNAFHNKQGFEVMGEINMVHGKEIFYFKKLH